MSAVPGLRLPPSVARAVVPPSPGLPGADHPEVLERIPLVARAVPVLAAVVSAAFERDGAEDLEDLDPVHRAAVIELVVIAWASAPAVRAALGVRARAPIAIAGRELAEELLQPVRTRGRRWREAP